MEATLHFRDGREQTGEIYQVRDSEINLDRGRWVLFDELDSITFHHEGGEW